jgi:RHS repeat-associated protein
VLGRVARISYPDGSFERYEYDGIGNITSITSPRGNRTFQYDANGRRIKEQDEAGKVTTWEYSSSGQIANISDPITGRRSFKYSATGSNISTIFSDNSAIFISYDPLRRVISNADQNGLATSFEYDPVGHLVGVISRDGSFASYTYDGVGNRIAQTDGENRSTYFEYDDEGRLTRRILPGGASESMIYDSNGNLIRRTNYDGGVVGYNYNSNNQMTQVSFGDGKRIDYTYTETNKRNTVTDSNGVTTYKYDNMDRLVEVIYPGMKSISYSYDLKGNMVSISISIGAQRFVTEYDYNEAGKISSVRDSEGGMYEFEYDKSNNLVSKRFPNGMVTTYEYDSLSRLRYISTVNTDNTIIQSYAYTIDSVGNRINCEEKDGDLLEYNYDDAYRLISERVQKSSGAIDVSSFSYDKVGNRLSSLMSNQDGQFINEYLYDERDRLLSKNEDLFSWSENGNLNEESANGVVLYAYDSANRLSRLTKHDGSAVDYTYDADGILNKIEARPVTGQPETTELLNDASSMLSRVMAEINVSEEELTQYIWAGSELLAAIRTDGIRYYHHDGLGSTRALSNEEGQVTDWYSYEPFGELREHIGSDGNRFLFAGEYRDEHTGFYYLRARWMYPGYGIFTSMDPFSGMLEDPYTLHRYLYANMDPINNSDPLGLFTTQEMVVSIAIIAVVTVMALSIIVAPHLRKPPTASELIANGEVYAHLQDAYNDSYPGIMPDIANGEEWDNRRHEHEEGGWIYMNKFNGDIEIVRGPPGELDSYPYSSSPQNYPLESVDENERDNYYIVAHFHTHPFPKGSGAGVPMWKWDDFFGPSGEDKRIHEENYNVPGIVYTFYGAIPVTPPERRSWFFGSNYYP